MRTTLRLSTNRQRGSLPYAIVVASATLLAVQSLAGNLTVVGNLTVSTNLTAQSVTLGGVTQTGWPGLPLQGSKYVVAAEGTNDIHRGNNLLAAYATATTLGPSSSNRVTVIVPPGAYNLGTTSLVMNTSYVDLVGLVPAQMTTKQVFTNSVGSRYTKTVANIQCPVRIYSGNSTGTIVQNIDNVRIESVSLSNTSGLAYYPSVNGSNTILRHVSMSSMPGGEYAGQYVDCVGGGGSFGTGSGIASGTFIDCVGGDDSFASADDSQASGTFIDCAGGDQCFGFFGNASGVFVRCVGGDYSFGGWEGRSSGSFIDCVGGDYSFSGWVGTLDAAAKLQHCKAGANSFGSFQMASDDFNYNVGGTNTFLMLPRLPTSAGGLPSGSVWSSNGVLRVSP